MVPKFFPVPPLAPASPRLPFAPACRPCWPALTVIFAVPVPPVLSLPCRSPRQSPVVPYNLGQVPVFLEVTVVANHGTNYLPLLALVKNISLLNPSLDPACTEGGGGVTPCLKFQNTTEVSTLVVLKASLLYQQLYGQITFTNTLWKATSV